MTIRDITSATFHGMWDHWMEPAPTSLNTLRPCTPVQINPHTHLSEILLLSPVASAVAWGPSSGPIPTVVTSTSTVLHSLRRIRLPIPDFTCSLSCELQGLWPHLTEWNLYAQSASMLEVIWAVTLPFILLVREACFNSTSFDHMIHNLACSRKAIFPYIQKHSHLS